MAVLSSLLKRAFLFFFDFSVGTTTATRSIQFRLRCHAELSKIDGTFPLCHVEGDVADCKKSVTTDRERAFC